MKRIFLLVIIFAIMTCMVACNIIGTKNADDSSITTVTASTTEVAVPKLPELSTEFVTAALQFIDEYSNGSDKLEELAAEVTQLSSNYQSQLYEFLNFYLIDKFGEDIRQYYGYNYSSVQSVKVFIHNYDLGGYVGVVSFNGREPTYNYDHDVNILAAGVLAEAYPDNVSLAQSRIASYVLTKMNEDDVVNYCIVTETDGSKNYDFTFENSAFKERAKEILLNIQ